MSSLLTEPALAGGAGLAGVRVWWPLPHCNPMDRMWRLGCRPAEGGVSSQRVLPTNPTVFLETKGWNRLQRTKRSLVLCHLKGRGQSYCGMLATSWRMRPRAEASHLQPADRSEFWIRWHAEQKGVWRPELRLTGLTDGDAQEIFDNLKNLPRSSPPPPFLPSCCTDASGMFWGVRGHSRPFNEEKKKKWKKKKASRT